MRTLSETFSRVHDVGVSSAKAWGTHAHDQLDGGEADTWEPRVHYQTSDPPIGTITM